MNMEDEHATPYLKFWSKALKHDNWKGMRLYTHLWTWVYSKQPMQELYISTLKVSVFLFLMFDGTVILALKENNEFG